MSLSTHPPPSSEDGNLEAIGEKTHQVEPEMEKQTAESNEPSTVASSTINGVEKPRSPEGDGPATEENAVEEPKTSVEYPSGVEVLFIMLALVLSITLISLDQVSSTAPGFSQSRLLLVHYTPVG
jgi:MFS transporter, DHA2 family, glioxin efflux transporter